MSKEVGFYFLILSLIILFMLPYIMSVDSRVLELQAYKFNSATHKEVEELLEKCRVMKSKYMKKECQIIVVVNDK